MRASRDGAPAGLRGAALGLGLAAALSALWGAWRPAEASLAQAPGANAPAVTPRPAGAPEAPREGQPWPGAAPGEDGLWPAQLPKAGPWPGPGPEPEASAVAAGRRFFLDHSFGATLASIPLPVWRALEAESPAFSPQAQAQRYGLVRLPGRALPVGFVPASAGGVQRVTFNCALCHVGLVGGKAWVGQPNTALRLQELEEALMGELKGPLGARLGDRLGAHNPELGWGEQLGTRLWLAIARHQAQGFTPSPQRMGPGRYDLLKRFKGQLKLPLHDFFAPMDIPALYGARLLTRYPRDGALGGDMDLVRFLIVRFSGDQAELQGGQVPPWVKELNAFLAALEPPPFPRTLDPAQVARGRAVFQNSCAPCHGRYEAPMAHPNAIVPIGALGTDPWRLKVWDAEAIAYTERDPLVRRLDRQPGVGFVPPSLRGVWATPPYLHPGSVPTLLALLGDGHDRPGSFARGPEVGWDLDQGGLAWRQAPNSAFLLDTTRPGNGRGGHLFGASLNPEERRAVIAYLQTL